MELSIQKSAIAGNYILSVPVFADNRGAFQVAWEKSLLDQHDISFVPKSSCHSYNLRPNTIRALHFQAAPYSQAKLVTCVSGKVWDIAVDIDPASPTFKQWAATELCAQSGKAHLIPKGCAHGFATLTEHSTVSYLIDGDYHPDSSRVIRWNDPELKIEWPTTEPILSDKDATAPLLSL